MNIQEAQRHAICPECVSEQGRLIANIEETRPYRDENDQTGEVLHYYCRRCHTRFTRASVDAASPRIATERIER